MLSAWVAYNEKGPREFVVAAMQLDDEYGQDNAHDECRYQASRTNGMERDGRVLGWLDRCSGPHDGGVGCAAIETIPVAAGVGINGVV